MTAVNGKTITYDQNGNPTNYVTYGDVEYYIEWENGRQLSYANCYEEQWQVAYRYDANGVRTYKNADGYESVYTTQNGKVVREVRSNRLHKIILDFIYDESGRPFALNYSPNGDGSFTMYYYILNLQGDVVKLVTASGETAASYEYDAWGKVLSATGSMALTNPLRYRGYYYDVETGFYYLQSRYYDPANRRFINADSYASTGQGFIGANMFAYCNNNPIRYADHNGRSLEDIIEWLMALLANTTASRLSFTLAIVNALTNSKLESNPELSTAGKILNDQNGATGDNYRYGFQTATNNGCEVIAIHNAKVLTGRESTFTQTALSVQLKGAMLAGGFFGSNPFAIGRVLHSEGIDYSQVNDVGEMTATGTYIISFWNSGAPWNGLHTVAVGYDGDTYTTYNLNGYGNESHLLPTEYANNFICGYYLG